MKKIFEKLSQAVWIEVILVSCFLFFFLMSVGSSLESVRGTEIQQLDFSDESFNESGAFGDWEDFSDFYEESQIVSVDSSKPSEPVSSEETSKPSEPASSEESSKPSEDISSDVSLEESSESGVIITPVIPSEPEESSSVIITPSEPEVFEEFETSSSPSMPPSPEDAPSFTTSE